MALKNEHITVNKYTRPGAKRGSTKGIILHYTANPGASADNHRRYFGNGGGGRYAGAHIFIDSKESLCIVPLNEVCYHANDVQKYVGGKAYRGASGKLGANANLSTIGIEMCIEKDGTIAAATFNQAVEVTADLCKTYKLDTDDLYRHYDVTGKNCPAPWVSKSSEWTRFKNAVKAKLGGKTVTTASKKKETAADKVKGTIKTLDKLNYYDGPRWNKATGTVAKGTVLTVTDRIYVGGAYQYKTVSGTYITASSKFVKFTAK
ncbi:N-acetylmuramoyl-L-alanine amidase [Kurthia populi]|uniref:N-acetylmuramoyl-L-alanine amidase n=1 Tax=Kurthia populi TaxID=1562132 RepID=A0ABW5XYK5_9BACL